MRWTPARVLARFWWRHIFESEALLREANGTLDSRVLPEWWAKWCEQFSGSGCNCIVQKTSRGSVELEEAVVERRTDKNNGPPIECSSGSMGRFGGLSQLFMRARIRAAKICRTRGTTSGADCRNEHKKRALK